MQYIKSFEEGKEIKKKDLVKDYQENLKNTPYF